MRRTGRENIASKDERSERKILRSEGVKVFSFTVLFAVQELE